MGNMEYYYNFYWKKKKKREKYIDNNIKFYKVIY